MTTRAPSLAVCLLAAGAMSGCFASKDLRTLDREIGAKARSVAEIVPLEKTQPDQALALYEEFLKAEEGFNKPLAYYQSQLKMQLRQMQGSKVQVLGDHVIAAFPYHFHERLKANIDAQLGASRVKLARGDTAGAERGAREALALLSRRARSRVFIARQTLAAAAQMAAVAAKNGRRGAALLAGSDREFAQLYLKGQAAAAQQSREAAVAAGIPEQMEKIDAFIAKLNRQRTMGAAVELASAIGRVAGGFDFSDAAAAVAGTAAAVAGGGTIVQAAAIGAMSAAATQVFLEGLDPVQYPSPVPQLLDPEAGAEARRLLAKLTVSAGKLSNDPELRQSCADDLASADAAVSAGRSGEAKRMEEAGERLAADFARLRSAVEAL